MKICDRGKSNKNARKRSRNDGKQKKKIFVSLRMTDEFRPLCQSKIYPQGNFHTRKKQDFFPP